MVPSAAQPSEDDGRRVLKKIKRRKRKKKKKKKKKRVSGCQLIKVCALVMLLAIRVARKKKTSWNSFVFLSCV